MNGVQLAPLRLKKLMYAIAIVILEMLGYKLNISQKEQYPPCRGRLEAKMEARGRKVRQIPELEKGRKKKE